MIVIGGNSNPKLANAVARHLGCESVIASTKKFSDDELSVKIEKNLYAREVVILQSTCRPVNDNLIELLLIADSARRMACSKITAVIPYFGYGRQDKPSSAYDHTPARLIAKIIENSGVDRVIALDMHSKQLEGFFRIAVENINTAELFANNFNDRKNSKRNRVVVSPDIGGVERAREFAAKIGADLAIINKIRSASGKCKASEVMGDIKNKECVIMDDIVDTGETLHRAASLLMKQGAALVDCYVTHAILSGECIKRIEKIGFKSFFTTDSILHKSLPQFVNVLSAAKLISQALL